MLIHRIPKRITICCILLSLCVVITGCQSAEKKTAKAEFDEASAAVEEKNLELETAIQTAESLLLENSPALDASLIPALESSISECKAAKYTIPERPRKLEEIIAATDELTAVDYAAVLNTLLQNQGNLEESIRRYALVNAPSEAYIIDCLKKVPNIIDIAAVTEDNDPNGNLNKQGGYTAHVYFSSDLIDQSIFDSTSVIENGTDCGGSIEVYSNVDDATKRNEYLASFDGGSLASGSHVVVGTVVVRTSDELKASQQKALESNIIAALTDNEEAISEPLEAVKQTQKSTGSNTSNTSQNSSSAPNAAGVYAFNGERIYLNSDGSYAYYHPDNGGGYVRGTWWQTGCYVFASYSWEGLPDYSWYETTYTLVDGNLDYYVKIG